MPVWKGWRAYLTSGDDNDPVPLRPAGPCVCRVSRWDAQTPKVINPGLVLLDVAALPFGPEYVCDDGKSIYLQGGLELDADWQRISDLLGWVPITVEFWFE